MHSTTISGLYYPINIGKLVSSTLSTKGVILH